MWIYGDNRQLGELARELGWAEDEMLARVLAFVNQQDLGGDLLVACEQAGFGNSPTSLDYLVHAAGVESRLWRAVLGPAIGQGVTYWYISHVRRGRFAVLMRGLRPVRIERHVDGEVRTVNIPVTAPAVSIHRTLCPKERRKCLRSVTPSH